MPYPRVIPHSDGAGVIDALGANVTTFEIGQKVWCYAAQSYRPFGTAAQYCVVPEHLVVGLPDSADNTLLEQAASLGIPGITGHRAIFADGPVDGLTVLVHGPAAGVGAIATQMAARGGAQVIGVVRRPEQAAVATRLGAHHVLTAGDPDIAHHIRDIAPNGVHRITEIDLAANAQLDADILAIGGVVSSYYSSRDTTAVPYWTFGFKDATLRLLGSDDFRPSVKATAAHDLTEALVEGSLTLDITHRLPLQAIAEAHELTEQGSARVVLTPVTST